MPVGCLLLDTTAARSTHSVQPLLFALQRRTEKLTGISLRPEYRPS